MKLGKKQNNLILAGLTAAIVTTALVVGCGKKELVPYRGTLLRNLPMNSNLVALIKREMKFDEANNCVQMVSRDRSEDGIRRVDTWVIFSPDACPTQPGKVADRESFAVRYETPTTVTPFVRDPVVAYYLYQGVSTWGSIAIVGKNDPDAADPFKHELVDLCTSGDRHRANCRLKTDVDGRFSQIVDTTAIGMAERDAQLINLLHTRLDGIMSGMNDMQRALVKRIDDSAILLENNLKANQNMAAIQVMEYTKTNLERLEANLSGAQRASFQALAGDVRTQLDRLRADIFEKIDRDVVKKLDKLLVATSDLQKDLTALKDDVLPKMEKRIVDDIVERVNKHTTEAKDAIIAKNAEALNTAIRRLVLAINLLEARLEDKISASQAEIFREIDRVGKQYAEETQRVLKGILETELRSVGTELGKLNTALGKLDKRVEDHVKKIEPQIEAVSKDWPVFRGDYKKNMEDLNKDLVQLRKDIDTKLEASQRAQLIEIDKLVKKYTEAARDKEIEAVTKASGELKDLIGAQSKTIRDNHKEVLAKVEATTEQIKTAMATANEKALGALYTKLVAQLDDAEKQLKDALSPLSATRLRNIKLALEGYAAIAPDEIKAEVVTVADALRLSLVAHKAKIDATLYANLEKVIADVKAAESGKKIYTNAMGDVFNQAAKDLNATEIGLQVSGFRYLVQTHDVAIRNAAVGRVTRTTLQVLANTEARFAALRRAIQANESISTWTVEHAQSLVDESNRAVRADAGSVESGLMIRFFQRSLEAYMNAIR